MNERDKELAKQAGYTKAHHDEYGRLTVMPEFNREKFADLIRADERDALKAEDWTTIMREGSLVTWGDAEELGERVRAVIRARGNT